MDFKMITSSDKMWNKVRDYAKSCSWGAGKSLANAMDNNLFTEWERVIIALIIRKSVDIVRLQRQIAFRMYPIPPTLVIYLLMKHTEETG